MSVDVLLGRRRFLSGAASTAALLGLPLLGAGASDPSWASAARAALARAHAWLWGVQKSDGRFASEIYGLLASGQSLTPFTLEGLLAGPPRLVQPRGDGVARAIGAMLSMRDENGALGLTGPVADYPCYATGMLLSCLAAARPDGWRDLAAPSVAWLRSQQLRARDGWEGHPAQGGWGMGGRSRRRPPDAGHVDLSMTRRVVQGLRAVAVDDGDPALEEASAFAARCQTSDGSFVYSPVELALNKGLRAPDGRPLGYGSATTDGVLLLGSLALASGEPFERGLHWLREHHRVDRNPGLDGGPMELFAEAMRGYYRAGAARCFAEGGGPAGWQERLVTAIASEQRDDGSFVGTSGLQKEDDPIIATGFAAQALAAALASVS